MICLWISIVIGFVNDFVIENKAFRKREPACGRAAGEVGMRFFLIPKK